VSTARLPGPIEQITAASASDEREALASRSRTVFIAATFLLVCRFPAEPAKIATRSLGKQRFADLPLHAIARKQIVAPGPVNFPFYVAAIDTS
jgi:hypothetical protein